jgi:uncharacterized OB-fold protein
MASTIPIVNYLRLDGGEPQLVSTDCQTCGARYLGTRIACAKCGGRKFAEHVLANAGTIGSFTIIHRAPRGVATPFVSALVDLTDGFTIKANIIDCPADPEHVRLGLRVQLRTFELASDDEGTTAIGFGFAPASSGETA